MGVGMEVKYLQAAPDSIYSGSSNINMGYKTGIEDFTLKSDFEYLPHPDHEIKFGLNHTYHTFKPGVSILSISEKENQIELKQDTTIGNKNIFSHETSLYVEDDFTINYAIKLNVGLHYSLFNVEKHTYQSLQPRVSARILANDNLSFKAGYAAMSQNVHLLSNASVSLPTDLWVPVTKRIKPMYSHQYSVGVFYNLLNTLDLSVEGYYKSMSNLIEYKDGASFLGSSTGWEDKVVMGDGWAYGVEFLAQKSFGKTTGWVGYTWAKAERLFNRPGQALNFGEVFPAKYDRRHDVSIVVSHKFSDRFDIAATWVFATGNTGTLALQSFIALQEPEYNRYGQIVSTYENLDYISGRNNYRFNSYHRLDLGMNFHKKKKYGTRTWNISVYNAYSNNNPFLVMPTEDYDWNPATNMYEVRKKLIQVSIFPIIPSISYSYKW